MPASPAEREAFAELLKKLREDAMTQRELASALEARGHRATDRAVSTWELGKNAPEHRRVVADLDEILGADGQLLQALGYSETEPALLREVMEELEERVSRIEEALHLGQPPADELSKRRRGHEPDETRQAADVGNPPQAKPPVKKNRPSPAIGSDPE